jgi:glucose/arabinose dehydrogenase
MKTLLTVGLCSVLVGWTTSYAMEDHVAHSSPDGSFTIKNIGDTAAPDHHFQIATRSGEIILASDKHPDFESGSFAESISWSPDNHYVAFSVRTSGPYIRDTFVYSVRSKQLLRLPTEDDDHQTRPIRWHDAQTLIVQTNAPIGGKATEDKDSYRYRRTIRLSDSPIQSETIYATP